MSRRNRHRKQRQARERAMSLRQLEADANRFAEELERDGLGKLGMSPEEVEELVRIATASMAQRFTREGLAARAPWGLAYDAEAARSTAEAGLLQFRIGDDSVQDRGDAPDLDEDESTAMMFQMIGGCLTMAAAASLYLRSVPITFALCRQIQTTGFKADGTREE